MHDLGQHFNCARDIRGRGLKEAHVRKRGFLTLEKKTKQKEHKQLNPKEKDWLDFDRFHRGAIGNQSGGLSVSVAKDSVEIENYSGAKQKSGPPKARAQ